MSDSENERLESPPVSSPVARDNGDEEGQDANGEDAAMGSGDDLFGDDDDDEGQLSDQPLSEHGLSDNEDEERYGDEGDETRQVIKEELVMDVDVFRHRVPKSSDGTLHSLRVPKFIDISPEAYDADTYEPTEAELEDSLAKNPKAVARFRRDAATGALQSNAALYRWSDGSVTLAIGSEHYEVLTKSLAPPSSNNNGASQASGKAYQELQDAHYYAAAAHLTSSLLLTVGHVTEQYTVRANHTVADDALERLTAKLHAASAGSANASTNMIIRTMRDPELAKKEAELAEKERERARRRRENASARLDGVSLSGGRSGRGGGGALSIGDLEGTSSRRGGPGGRKRGQPGASRPKRRRPEYDSDDELPQGARRNDDYDKADDFIAPSDDEEEEEEEDDDDDEEELLDDDDDDDDDHRRGGGGGKRRTKRQKTAEAEDDEDAEADPDNEVPSRPSGGAANDAARRARRHVLEDDDDE